MNGKYSEKKLSSQLTIVPVDDPRLKSLSVRIMNMYNYCKIVPGVRSQDSLRITDENKSEPTNILQIRNLRGT